MYCSVVLCSMQYNVYWAKRSLFWRTRVRFVSTHYGSNKRMGLSHTFSIYCFDNATLLSPAETFFQTRDVIPQSKDYELKCCFSKHANLSIYQISITQYFYFHFPQCLVNIFNNYFLFIFPCLFSSKIKLVKMILSCRPTT